MFTLLVTQDIYPANQCAQDCSNSLVFKTSSENSMHHNQLEQEANNHINTEQLYFNVLLQLQHPILS